jgi:uncharacterized pyridoxal phosphate-containing UPF0001 family protein
MFPVHVQNAPDVTIDQAQSSCKMNNLKENLHHICARVASACEKTGRNPADIAILAVSKKHPVERIRALHQLGQTSFGENYVQEALAKMEQLKQTEPKATRRPRLGKTSEAQARREVRFCRRQRSADRLPSRVSGTRGVERRLHAVESSRLPAQPGAGKRNALDFEWHFIGPLQSNKTREVAEHFQWVQSVDRIKILRRLSSQRPLSHPDLNICIQVNIDREQQKAGVMPELVKEIARAAMALPRLRLRGLMTIPQAASALHDPSGSYARMETLFHDLIDDGMELDTLSMGMSGDLEAAIMHGSTMVRIGTDLFGPRPDNGAN